MLPTVEARETEGAPRRLGRALQPLMQLNFSLGHHSRLWYRIRVRPGSPGCFSLLWSAVVLR